MIEPGHVSRFLLTQIYPAGQLLGRKHESFLAFDFPCMCLFFAISFPFHASSCFYCVRSESPYRGEPTQRNECEGLLWTFYMALPFPFGCEVFFFSFSFCKFLLLESFRFAGVDFVLLVCCLVVICWMRMNCLEKHKHGMKTAWMRIEMVTSDTFVLVH